MTAIEDKASKLQKLSIEHYGDVGAPDICHRVEEMFAPFADIPYEPEFDTPLDDAYSAMEKLSFGRGSTNPVEQSSLSPNPELSDLAKVTGELTEWRGEASDTFRDNVQIPFRDYLMFNLCDAACILHGILGAQKALWKQVYDDAHELIDDAIDVVESLNDCSKDSLVNTISVVTAIASIPMTGPAGPIAIAAASAGGSILGAAEDESIEGDEPSVVLGHVEASLEKLKKQIITAEEEMQKVCTTLAENLAQGGKEYELVILPSLATGPGGIDGYR